MAIPVINEGEINAVKKNIRENIDRLISCKDYIKDVDNNQICKAMKFNIDGIEQVAKDQLILPILRLLGYSTEYKEGHFDVWAEAKISIGIDNKKSVDYAIFCKDDPTHAPRLIVEAKALTKLGAQRPDYDSPDKQIQSYYQERRDSIYLPIVSNGEYFCIYRREKTPGNDKSLGKCEDPFKFSLEDLKTSDEALDLFVQLAAKCVIEKFAKNQCTTDDYDEHIKRVQARLTLRKLITEKLLNSNYLITPDRFQVEYNAQTWMHKKIYKNIIITGDPDKKENQDKADKICKSVNLEKPKSGKGKSNDKFEEELNTWYDDLYNLVYGIYIELYNGLSNDTARPAITTGGDDHTGGTKPPIILDKPKPWQNNGISGITTQLELNILAKIKQICGHGDDIKYKDNDQYITFFISDINQEDILHGQDSRNREVQGKVSAPWFMRYGNIVKKECSDPEHAQNDDKMRNACITLYHKDKTLNTLKVNSLSDFDAEDIKAAIKECFDYWYDKWSGNTSNS